MESECKSKEGDDITRHCAYCLQLCGTPAKLCGGCKKRAYCSRECQAKDWPSKGDGQRHVNWCRRHEYGEEDVDWEVVPIPNKGLGVRAKKLIPAGMKIIVEPVFNSPTGHSGMTDLGPEGTTLEEKFGKNLFIGENMAKELNQNLVALRIARVNHSCQPNAATIFDETARVAILFSQKDIQPGEEISICYYASFFFLIPIEHGGGVKSIEEELHSLAVDHGITCLANCSCNDPAIRALTLEGRKMYTTVRTLVREHKIEEALDAGEKLLGIYRSLNLSWIYRAHTEHLLFRIAVRKSETLPRAMEFIRSAAELFDKICPYSERVTKMFEKLWKNPETDPDYLAIDKMGSNLGGR